MSFLKITYFISNKKLKACGKIAFIVEEKKQNSIKRRKKSFQFLALIEAL